MLSKTHFPFPSVQPGCRASFSAQNLSSRFSFSISFRFSSLEDCWISLSSFSSASDALAPLLPLFTQLNSIYWRGRRPTRVELRGRKEASERKRKINWASQQKKEKEKATGIYSGLSRRSPSLSFFFLLQSKPFSFLLPSAAKRYISQKCSPMQ